MNRPDPAPSYRPSANRRPNVENLRPVYHPKRYADLKAAVPHLPRTTPQQYAWFWNLVTRPFGGRRG